MRLKKRLFPFWLAVGLFIIAGLLLYCQSLYAPEISAKRFLSGLNFDDLIILEPTNTSRIYSLEKKRELSRLITYKVIDKKMHLSLQYLL